MFRSIFKGRILKHTIITTKKIKLAWFALKGSVNLSCPGLLELHKTLGGGRSALQLKFFSKFARVCIATK